MDTRISVIIPVYNEEHNLLRLFEQLEALRRDCEIIFVDGGSSDTTVSMIHEKGYRLLFGKGRGQQLNRGAAAATGEILFFLHCDSVLPPQALQQIHQVMQRFDMGFFGIRFDSPDWVMDVCARQSNRRARIRHIPFGDQGIFITRSAFERIGGFPEIPLMEDYEFSLRARAAGIRMGQTRSPLTTSAVRFGKGFFHQLWVMYFMHKLRYLYRHGTPPEELAQLYKRTSAHANKQKGAIASGKVIMLTRVPSERDGKTRMAPLLGPKQRKQLQELMILDELDAVFECDAKPLICFTPVHLEQEIRELTDNACTFLPQEGENLGERMLLAFKRCFERGEGPYVLIGSDLPQLQKQDLEQAFSLLQSNDVVLGPTPDGGYYLIGMNELVKEAFPSICYGNERVLESTLRSLAEAGKQCALVQEKSDVDTPKDLKALLQLPTTFCPRTRSFAQTLFENR